MKTSPIFALTIVSLLTPILADAQDRTLGKVSVEPVQESERAPAPPQERERAPAPPPRDNRAEPPPSAAPIKVTVDNFNDVVIDNDRYVLVDFWAPWCGPCRSMEPTLDKIARDFAGRVDVAKINVDEEEPLSEHMEINALPTLFLFKNGRPVDMMVGFVDERTLLRSIDRELNQPRASSEPIRERERRDDDRDVEERKERSRDPDPRAITQGSRPFP